MKTIQLFTAAVVLGFLSTGMGFPTVLDKNATTTPVAETSACTTQLAVNDDKDKKGNAKKDDAAAAASQSPEEDPIQIALVPAINASLTEITLKVFDVNGCVVMTETVTMSDLLGKHENRLPAGSTFVMFSENTAYYFVDEADMAQN